MDVNEILMRISSINTDKEMKEQSPIIPPESVKASAAGSAFMYWMVVDMVYLHGLSKMF